MTGVSAIDQRIAEADLGGRAPKGPLALVIAGLCLAWSIFQLWVASPIPFWICCTQAAFFSSIMRWMIGVRISSIAKPILPPFTTIEVGLDMKESWIMSSR